MGLRANCNGAYGFALTWNGPRPASGYARNEDDTPDTKRKSEFEIAPRLLKFSAKIRLMCPRPPYVSKCQSIKN